MSRRSLPVYTCRLDAEWHHGRAYVYSLRSQVTYTSEVSSYLVSFIYSFACHKVFPSLGQGRAGRRARRREMLARKTSERPYLSTNQSCTPRGAFLAHTDLVPPTLITYGREKRQE